MTDLAEDLRVEPPATRVPWWSDLRRFVPLAVGLVLAVVVTDVWQQVTHPFFEHDDWFYLLPVESFKDNVVYDRLLAEGRWLNYTWWLGPGHLFSPVGAALLYEVAFLTLIGRLAWRWAPGWLCVPTVVALAVSPMVLELTFWPSTLGLSMTICAVAACSLAWCAQTPRRLAVWVVVFTVLTFVTYPPVTLVLFVILIVELVERSLRDLVLVTILFGLSYVASTLLVFALNLAAFGKFGVVVRPWRDPNALHDLGDLGENLSRVGHQLADVVGVATIPIALGALAVVACVALPATRERGTRLVHAALVAWGLQSMGTVMTGAVTPFRSSGWVWIVIVVAIVWLFATVELRTWIRGIAGVAVIVTCVWGARAWIHGVDYNQNRLDVYNKVDHRLALLTAQHPKFRVLILGTETEWKDPTFQQEAEYLREVARYRRGTDVPYCRPPGCYLGKRPSVAQRVRQGVTVIRSGDFILVIPPSHYRPMPAFYVGGLPK